MVNEGFCASCQEMLAETDVLRMYGKGSHHPNGDSFQQAIRMGCRICVHVWVDLNRPDVLLSTASVSLPSIDDDMHSIGIRHGDSYVWIVLKPQSVKTANVRSEGCETNSPRTWLSGNTGSAQSFEFLMSKYTQCTLQHQKCIQPKTGKYLPSRLLDVGTEQHAIVRLADRGHSLLDASYVTLSHCWGTSVPLKLTASTEAMLGTGVADGQLSKTFLHAVMITRKMNLSYLWIDSL